MANPGKLAVKLVTYCRTSESHPVTILPGATALQVMLRLAKSTAICFVMYTAAAFPTP